MVLIVVFARKKLVGAFLWKQCRASGVCSLDVVDLRIEKIRKKNRI